MAEDSEYQAHLAAHGIASQAERITALVRNHQQSLSPERDSVPAPPPSDPIAEAVAGLKKCGIRMLAIDFDQTFVDCHTGGNYTRGPGPLSERVRDFMPGLVSEAVRRGLHVAICTFSPQTQLVAEVLGLVIPSEVAATVVIRGNDYTWEIPRGCEGKQAHLASACAEFGGDIRMEECCLIDDDNRNIMFARCGGVMGVLCPCRDGPSATKDAVLNALFGGRKPVGSSLSPKQLDIPTNCSPRSPYTSPHQPPTVSTRESAFKHFSSPSSPPPSPHSPYSPYPTAFSPRGGLGLGSSPRSPYHSSPRSPLGMARSPLGMGGKGGMSPRGRFF